MFQIFSTGSQKRVPKCSLTVRCAYKANCAYAVEVKCHYEMSIYIKGGTVGSANIKSQGHTSLISPVPHSFQEAFLKKREAESPPQQHYFIIASTRCQPACNILKKLQTSSCVDMCSCFLKRKDEKRQKGVAENNCSTAVSHSATIGNLIKVSILCLASNVFIFPLWPAIAA